MYLLDTNVFIEAKNRYYGLDFCPAFWDWLKVKHREGKVFSIRKVFEELMHGKDQLSRWASKELPKEFFIEPDSDTLKGLVQVADWVNGQNYKTNAVRDFLNCADYYLIAHALTHEEFIIVTHEVPSISPNISRRKVKIPDVCKKLEIRWMSTFDMLRAEKARFK